MRKRKFTDEDLASIGGEPRIGEVWWCRGDSLRFADGGKVRPVLIVDLTPSGAIVIPMTTRKPASTTPVAVGHQGGQSWLTSTEIAIPAVDLVSSLGRWHGYDVWRMTRR